MLLGGATEGEAGQTLGLPASEVEHAVQRTIHRLRLSSPTAGIA